MKVTIETLKDMDVRVTLNFKGKDYSETWRGYKTIDGDIVNKLEQDGITAEDTDIEEFLNSFDVIDFRTLAENEDD